VSEELIGFGSGDKSLMNGGRADSYKGEKDRKDRIALVWLNKDEKGEYYFGDDEATKASATPKFKVASYHYVPGMGYIESVGEYSTAKFGAPKRRIGTFVLQYKTDKQGNLFKGPDGKPVVDFEVKEWKFSEDKYRTLASIHEEFNLCAHDIRIECTDAGFQKMTFTPTNGKALWQRDPTIRKAVLDKVASMEPHFSLTRKVTVEDIKAHLGEGESVVPSVSSDINYDDLMDDLT